MPDEPESPPPAQTPPATEPTTVVVQVDTPPPPVVEAPPPPPPVLDPTAVTIGGQLEEMRQLAATLRERIATETGDFARSLQGDLSRVMERLERLESAAQAVPVEVEPDDGLIQVTPDIPPPVVGEPQKTHRGILHRFMFG